MRKVYYIATVLLLIILGCDKPQDILTPTHFSRVPQGYDLSATVDTTVTGKYRISLKWKADDMTNLRTFEVYRAFGAPLTFSVLQPAVTTTAYVDSFAASITDTLNLYYHVIGTGIDRFVGQSSDNLLVTIKKK
jgi:hypothetical protein